MPIIPSADVPPSAVDHDDKALGERLRARRVAKGLTLKDVAARADMSIGSISQIERGVSSPSIRTLRGICHALGIDGAELFAPADVVSDEPDAASASRIGMDADAGASTNTNARITPSMLTGEAVPSAPADPGRAAVRSNDAAVSGEYLVRADRHKPLRLHGTGITKYRVTPSSCNAMEAYLMELDPGAFSDPNFLVQTGDKVGYVIEGKLQLFVGDQSFLLETGDTYGFAANQAYRWINGWDKKTRFLVVNSNHFYV